LKDRLHMATEGIFVVVLTIQKGSGRLMTSPDIISRGFIYLRDSEELMGMIRQYLKQKVARTFTGKHVDLDVAKKELKDDISHILYDQTRRTPIVIPVINEVGGGNNPNSTPNNSMPNNNQNRPQYNNGGQRPNNNPNFQRNPNSKPVIDYAETGSREFPQRLEPDSEAVEPKRFNDSRGY
jgi:ribonuclease J